MRRLMIVAGVVLVLAGIGSFAVWLWAESKLADGYAQWADGMRAQGWTVASAPPERSGWPVAVELTLPDLAVTGGAALAPAGVAWTAARATLRLDLLHPASATIRFTGRQAVRLGGPDIPFTADRFVVTLPLSAGAPPRSATLDASQLRFGAPMEGMTAGLLEGQANWQQQSASVWLRLSAEAIALPPPPAPQAALGSHIASATAEAVLGGTLPALAGPYAMASAWRAGGGTLDLRRVALGWGPLGVTGGASLSLDEAMQPAGSADLRLVGYADALDALVAGHVLSAQAAKAAKAVLGLMARPAQGGAGVELPLTLHDQTLAMGLFPLAKLPKLVWPDAPGSANVN